MLLAANVSFLAIPSVDQASEEASWSQILSILSVIASIGSIILGLLLVRQHRTKSKDSAEDAVRNFNVLIGEVADASAFRLLFFRT